MDILLDTHATIWLFEGNEKMPKSTAKILDDLKNMVYVSIASVWEVAIKISIGKLEFDGGIENFIDTIYQNEFELLTISPKHIEMVTALQYIHRDPFDRMLVVQSIAEDMAIMTLDENILKYDVKPIW